MQTWLPAGRRLDYRDTAERGVPVGSLIFRCISRSDALLDSLEVQWNTLLCQVIITSRAVVRCQVEL